MAVEYTHITGENRTADFNFSRYKEIIGGDTLTGSPSIVQIVGDGALSFGSFSIVGKIVRAVVSGGTVGVTYTHVLAVSTTNGRTLKQTAKVKVVSNT